MKRREIPLTLLLSKVLGNSSMSGRLRQAVEEIGWPVAEEIDITAGDWSALGPLAQRLRGDSLSAVAVATRAIRRQHTISQTIGLANSWEFGLAMLESGAFHTSVVAHDTAPTISSLRNAGWLNQGRRRILVSQFSTRICAARFRRYRDRLGGLLPMSSAASHAMVSILGRSDVPVEITLSPQRDLDSHPEIERSSQKLRLAFVGDDLFRKGADIFADVVGHLRHKIPVEALLISRSADARALAEQHQIAHRGDVSSSGDVRQILHSMDILILPTRRDYMPNVVAESLAVGTPVLATAIGGIPELVIPGRTGWLLESPPSAFDASQQILSAADSGELWSVRSTASGFAKQHLNWGCFVEKVDRILWKAQQRARREN